MFIKNLMMINVLPADMNGSGKPVGGTRPVNTSYCIIKFYIAYKLL